MITRRAWLGGIAASLMPGRAASARGPDVAVYHPSARWPAAEVNGVAFDVLTSVAMDDNPHVVEFFGRVEPLGRTAEHLARILSIRGYFVIRPPHVRVVEFYPRCVPLFLEIGDTLSLTDDWGRFAVGMHLWLPGG